MEAEEQEQAIEEVQETSQESPVEEKQGLSQILTTAIQNQTRDSEASGQPDEGQATEQSKQPEKTVQTPYGEITLDEAKKIAFKTEDEFQAFLEKNPFLKSHVMRQSDYTRKTQQVSEERKKLQEEMTKWQSERTKTDEAWGSKKPTSEDMGFFHDFWHVFQNGSDQLAQKLVQFAQDVSQIARGGMPKGPLAGQDGKPPEYAQDGRIVQLKREFDQYKTENERKAKAYESQAFESQVQDAIKVLDQWKAEKLKNGIEVTQDELQEMSKIRFQDEDKMKQDEIFENRYRAALARLGKSEKTAIKKAVVSAKEASRNSPRHPTSRGPANAQPDAKSLKEILTQGAEKLGMEV